VLLLQQRRKVERGRTMVRAAAAALVPGLGLLARRRVFAALTLLAVTTLAVSRWLDVTAPFALADELGPDGGSSGWAMLVGCALLYAVSLLGYFGTPEPDAPAVKVAPPSRTGNLSEPPARAA
jgi:hypothetical protein